MASVLEFPMATSRPCHNRDAFTYARVYTPRYHPDTLALGREIPDLDDVVGLYDAVGAAIQRKGKLYRTNNLAGMILFQHCPNVRHTVPPYAAEPRAERLQTYFFAQPGAESYEGGFTLSDSNEDDLAVATFDDHGGVLPGDVIVQPLPASEVMNHPFEAIVRTGFQRAHGRGLYAALSGQERIITPQMLGQ